MKRHLKQNQMKIYKWKKCELLILNDIILRFKCNDNEI
jgi:hypothetical protein